MTTTPEKKVTKYSVTDHGIDHSQYFQGHGISCTDYEDCATGFGESYNEAFEDALDCLAQNGWDMSNIVNEDSKNPKSEWTVSEWLDIPEDSEEESCDDCYYYVSIDVK